MKPATRKKAGRPPSRPKGYSQRSVWLPDTLHADVLRALVTPDAKRYEFSKLVDHLLRRWLDAGGKLPKE